MSHWPQAAPLADLASACGTDPQLACDLLYRWTGNETATGVFNWLLNRPLRILLILIVAAVIARFVGKAIERFTAGLVTEHDPSAPIHKDTHGDGRERDNLFERGVHRLRDLGDQQVRARQRALTLGSVLRSVSRAAIWLVAALMILGEVGINLGPLLAGAGIAGIAFGFGAQSLVRDFLAGIFIIIEDQYGVGDIVDVGPTVGTVELVTMRTTRLRDPAGVLWTVPNGEIRRVGNSSQLWSKSLLDIEVSYDTDIDFATRVIKGVLDELWQEDLSDATIIEEPTVLGVEGFGPDAIVIRAIVKTEPAEQFVVARVIRARLKKAFDEAGIEIPFPQRTVWIRNDDPNKSE